MEHSREEYKDHEPEHTGSHSGTNLLPRVEILITKCGLLGMLLDEIGPREKATYSSLTLGQSSRSRQ